MKKTLVALATMATVSAYAQTVAITGGINFGVFRSEASAQTFGSLKGDRTYLSFDVSEDIGGGTNVISRAQMRFNSSNGATWGSNTANSTELGKGATLMEQVMVGLTDNKLGTIKFGRFTNDLGTYDYSTFEDSPIGTNASGAIYGRLSGQIQYTSPTVAGFTVSALQADAQANAWMASASNGLQTGINYSTYSATGFNNFGSAIIKYENGPWLAQAATIGGLVGDKNTRIGVRYTTSNGAKYYFSSFKQSGNIGQVLTTMSTTALYTLPVARNSTYSFGLQEHTSTELGMSYPVGQTTLRAAYVTNNNDLEVGKSDGTTKATKVALGLDYSLSKRSTIIIQGSKVTNSSYAASLASIYSVSGTAGTGGNAYFVGLQSTF